MGRGGGGGVGGLGGAAGDEGVEAGGEVDDGGVGSLLEEETVAELFGSAAAEGDDGAAQAEQGGQGEGLEVAEVGFAVLGKDLGDGALVAGFDLAVEVEEAPGETLGEESARGGFAGAHEAGEDDAIEHIGLRNGAAGDCTASGSWIFGGFRFRGHGLCWCVEGCCRHCRLRGVSGESKDCWGQKKNRRPCGLRLGGWLGFSWVESEKRTAPPGRWWIPVAIAKSAGGEA